MRHIICIQLLYQCLFFSSIVGIVAVKSNDRQGYGGNSSTKRGWGNYNGGATSNSLAKEESDPYKILGVTRDATQEDIQKKYRSLCLKYHPDKNVHRTPQEQEECEDMFKRIQQANSLIGTTQDRKKYDSLSFFQQRQRSESGPFSSSSNDDSHLFHGPKPHPYYYNYPYTQQFQPRKMRRRAFYVNGIDVSHFFDPLASFGSRGSWNPLSSDAFYHDAMQSQSPLANTYRSIFIEKITVPLEDLYNGIQRQKFQLKDTIVQRYRAAFRGGIATQLALQSLLTSLPLLFRVSWVVSVIGFLATFHLSLPRPSRLSYYSQIRPGWKGGTKLKFHSVEPGLDVVFVLQEGKHDRFQRDGNNLMTQIQVTKSSARKGCTLFIEPLGKNEIPITVKLKAGEIVGKHHTVTVVGRGWPKPSGGAGDLMIQVDVVSDARYKAQKQQQKRGRTRR